MKGKNKEQTPGKQLTSTATSKQELSLPDVTPLDHVKFCPRYTSILNRPDGDGVGIEEMDTLQMEIESLLVNVMQRNRLLKIETMILDNDKIVDTILTPQASSSVTKANSFSTNGINTPKDKSMTKKNKSFSGKPAVTPGLNNSVVQESPPIVRNKIPDIFWQSVEPYCSDITQDDLKYLESQIEQSDNFINSAPKIGPLGKHYSLQWAEEDLNYQIKEGSRFPDLDSKTTPTNGVKRKASLSSDHTPTNYFLKKQSLIEESLEKLNKNQQTESISYGPLTQRLISALIEQNLMTPFDNKLNDYLDSINTPQSSYMSPKSMAKKFTFNFTGSNMEKKLKKTLIEQGILDADEIDKSDLISEDNSIQSEDEISKDDEVAQEIINVQNELKQVSKQCKERLEELLGIANENFEKQEIKKKISSIDTEIMENYERVKIARLNKQPVCKKDKERIQYLMTERDSLREQLKN